MRYISLFSGIEAASVAWEPLGWNPVAFAEIDKNASKVLAYRYPDTPNLGDITQVDWSRYAGVDVLVGGSPCQSFSVAGLRQGLADPRGNLVLEYLRAVDAMRPRWVVWENVPGVLSSWSGPEPPRDLELGQEWESSEASDFGCFLDGLRQLGYGFAYRVLDAQYVRVESHARAVPQRRRRVFVVGHLGGWAGAVAALLEQEGLRGHTPPRREAGQGIADDVAGSLGSRGTRSHTELDGHGAYIPEVSNALCANDYKGSKIEKGLGQPVIAFAENQRGELRTSEVAMSLSCAGGKPGSGYPAVAQGYAVRRLTPLECERLQGFPDDWTLVPTSTSKDGTVRMMADGPRYKMIGNSMATNAMRFIGERIACVEGRAK